MYISRNYVCIFTHESLNPPDSVGQRINLSQGLKYEDVIKRTSNRYVNNASCNFIKTN